MVAIVSARRSGRWRKEEVSLPAQPFNCSSAPLFPRESRTLIRRSPHVLIASSDRILAPFSLSSSNLNEDEKKAKRSSHRTETRMDRDHSPKCISFLDEYNRPGNCSIEENELWWLGCDPCRGRSWSSSSSSSSYFWKSLDHRIRPSSWWGGAPDDHGPPAAPFMGAPAFRHFVQSRLLPTPKIKKMYVHIYISIRRSNYDSPTLCARVH